MDTQFRHTVWLVRHSCSPVVGGATKAVALVEPDRRRDEETGTRRRGTRRRGDGESLERKVGDGKTERQGDRESLRRRQRRDKDVETETETDGERSETLRYVGALGWSSPIESDRCAATLNCHKSHNFVAQHRHALRRSPVTVRLGTPAAVVPASNSAALHICNSVELPV